MLVKKLLTLELCGAQRIKPSREWRTSV